MVLVCRLLGTLVPLSACLSHCISSSVEVSNVLSGGRSQFVHGCMPNALSRAFLSHLVRSYPLTSTATFVCADVGMTHTSVTP